MTPEEVYNPRIPSKTVFPNSAQDDILSNFYWLNQYFANDHLPLTENGSTAGFHTKLFFPQPIEAAPDLTTPLNTTYPLAVNNLVQLFFQNGNLASNIEQLTFLGATAGDNGFYIETPFGLIFNFGEVRPLNSSTVFKLPKPYTTPYSIVATLKNVHGPGNTASAVFVGTDQFKAFQSSQASVFYFAVGI